MADYILFMHGDAAGPAISDDGARWGRYLSALRESGQFEGGSSIGRGLCVRNDGSSVPAPAGPTGDLRLRAASLDDARRFLAGNPVYEAGGTIDIRELPVDE